MDARFSVSWSAYQKNICNGFSYLQQRGEFVDMTLAADGHHVQVHKMVLCLVSPYIKELVAATQCSHPVIFLNNVSSATLLYILEYVYTGEALVPREKIKEFLQACKSLSIKGLENTNTVEDQKEIILNTALEQLNDNKPIELKIGHETSLTEMEDNNDQVATSYDDEDHDNGDFLEDNDQEMTIDNQTIISSIETQTKKQQQIKKSITSKSNETRLQYTVSAQGQLQIILNRFLYSFHYIRNRTDDMVWRCLSNRAGCPATVVTKDGVIVRRLKAHNHPFADRTILKRLKKGIVYSEFNEAQNVVHATKTNNQGKKSTNNQSTIESDDEQMY